VTSAGPAVEILLATHDGERFLGAQVESVLRQTSTDWSLIIRDDCSRDGTVDIARRYAAAHPDRIRVDERATPSGSAKASFLELLADSTAPYVMFCDQDDVWLDDKVEVTLAAMQDLERRHGAQTPLLVHTDLTVTDADLAVTAPSMAAAQQLAVHDTRLPRVLTQNVVTGCTVMANRALVDLVRPPFDAVAMHDWWLATIATALGAVGYVDRPTVLYRQHGDNTVGARPSRSLRYRLDRLLDKEGVTASLAASYAQAAAFGAAFGERLTPEQARLVAEFASIPRLGKLARLRVIRRFGFWKNTAARRLGQVLYV
jgi:glycosyltransferase involved in cell wall biosynthesis